MVKNTLILLLTLGIGLIMYDVYEDFKFQESLPLLGDYYARKAASETGSANLVTAVVVTYRGFDTLGEVSILFLTASIISFMFKYKEEHATKKEYRPASELLISSTQVFTPIMLIVGIYIFANGHLSPGGGFQGGAVIASAFLLMLLANPGMHLSHKIISRVESISGIGFVLAGVAGLVYAGGFLDNTVLSKGEFGHLLSAGLIPIIYIFIGLKVGAELSNIVSTMSHLPKENN